MDHFILGARLSYSAVTAFKPLRSTSASGQWIPTRVNSTPASTLRQSSSSHGSKRTCVNKHIQPFVDHRPNRSMKGSFNADACWTEM